MQAPSRPTVVVADDQAIVRHGLMALIEGMGWPCVVGEAADDHELLQLLESVVPDVVVLDLVMPGIDGVALVGTLHRLYPRLRLLAVALDDSPDAGRRALRAGAAGFVSKGAPAGALENALREVLAAQVQAPPPQPIETLPAAPRKPPKPAQLTPRQRRIAVLLAQGKTSTQIAGELGLSVNTVNVYRSAIWKRLGIKGVASLTRYAVREGLLPREPGT